MSSTGEEKEIPLADVLSRVTPTPVEEDGIQLPIVACESHHPSNIPVSSSKIDLIHGETAKDPTLNLLRHYIQMGWPVDRRMLSHEIHTFWNYREDLSMENGLITKGARLVIPSTLRSKVLEQIHEGHLGIEKCMLKARDSVFWPEISNDIRETVEKCGICQASSKAAKSIGNVSDVPPHAWHNTDTSRIQKELLRRQPNTTSTGTMDLEPGQPVFVKEVHGNVWRTATVDQPAAEPDSYWVRFPDDSILRRTRSMIKPRSLPSHFELQAEAQQRNFEGNANSHSCDSFRQLNE